MKQYESTQILTPEPSAIARAAELIRGGELVAFPTETVYGLGANAYDGEAVADIFRAKGRPGDNPLICHVDSWQMAERFCTLTPLAQKLAALFCPGPLTLVLPKRDNIPDAVTAGLPSVAVRMPAHPVAAALITACGLPIAAPSANTSGKPSPTLAQHVYEDMAGRIPLILDGGPVEIGLESTVVDARGQYPVLLRPGRISFEQLAEAAGACLLPTAADHQRPASPGMKYRHYAPAARVYLLEQPRELLMQQQRLTKQQQKVAVLVSARTADRLQALGMAKEAITVLGDSVEQIASRWFDALRQADRLGYDAVLAERYPEAGLGRALMNRMSRAAGESSGEIDPAAGR